MIQVRFGNHMAQRPRLEIRRPGVYAIWHDVVEITQALLSLVQMLTLTLTSCETLVNAFQLYPSSVKWQS